MGTRSEVLSLVEYERRGKRRGCRRGWIEDIQAPRIGANMLADDVCGPRLFRMVINIKAMVSKYRS